MEIINENTTLTLTLTFEDENGDAVTPSAARYKLDDVSSGASVLAWTAFSPSSSTHDLVITATQNAIVNTELALEKKLITVEITYGLSAKKRTAKYIYGIMNISDDYLEALEDLVGGDLPLEDSEKIKAISGAVARYSSHRPREVTEEVDGAGVFDYLLSDLESWLDDFSSIKTVEYPVDDSATVPDILADDAWTIFKKSTGYYLRFLDDEPAATEEFRIKYTAQHVCTNALCTIPASDEQAVQFLSASLFCDMLATYYAQTSDSTILADSVDHKSKASEYAARARAYAQKYSDYMGIKEGAAVTAASLTRDQDAQTSHRQDHLTHPRRFR